jgi:hypothetical protein
MSQTTIVRSRPLELTAAQARVLRAQRAAPGAACHNVGQYIDLDGPLDVPALREAVARTLDEAPWLRFRLRERDDGTVRQEQLPPGTDRAAEGDGRADRRRLPLLDTSGAADPVAAAVELVREQLACPPRLDLLLPGTADTTGGGHADPAGNGPGGTPGVPGAETAAPTGAVLVRVGPGRHLLFQYFHQLAVDGYGVTLLTRRIAEVYTELVRGSDPGPTPFAPLSALVEAERAYAGSAREAADRAHWAARFADRPRPTRFEAVEAPPSDTALRYTAVLGPRTASMVAAAARASRATWAEAVAATVAVQLRLETGTDEAVLPLYTMARCSPGTLRVPGTAVNILPVRLRLEGGDTFAGLLERTAAEFRAVRAHQRFRGEELAAWMWPGTGGDRLPGPLLNLRPFDTEADFAGTPGRVVTLASGPVDGLSVSAVRYPDGRLRLDFDANPALYDAVSLARHARRCTALLERLCAEPGRPLSAQEPLHGAEAYDGEDGSPDGSADRETGSGPHHGARTGTGGQHRPADGRTDAPRSGSRSGPRAPGGSSGPAAGPGMRADSGGDAYGAVPDGGGEEWGGLPLLPAAHRLREAGGPVARLQDSVLLQVPPELSAGPLRRAVARLARAHPALRLRLHRTAAGPGDADVWAQEVLPSALAPAVADPETVCRVETGGASGAALAELVAAYARAAVSALDPWAGRVLRVVWFDAGPDEPGRLLLTAHRLSADAASWRLLVPELAALWAAFAEGRETAGTERAARSGGLRAWAEALVLEAHRRERLAELPYWSAVHGPRPAPHGAAAPPAGDSLGSGTGTVVPLRAGGPGTGGTRTGTGTGTGTESGDAAGEGAPAHGPGREEGEPGTGWWELVSEIPVGPSGAGPVVTYPAREDGGAGARPETGPAARTAAPAAAAGGREGAVPASPFDVAVLTALVLTADEEPRLRGDGCGPGLLIELELPGPGRPPRTAGRLGSVHPVRIGAPAPPEAAPGAPPGRWLPEGSTGVGPEDAGPGGPAVAALARTAADLAAAPDGGRGHEQLRHLAPQSAAVLANAPRSVVRYVRAEGPPSVDTVPGWSAAPAGERAALRTELARLPGAVAPPPGPLEVAARFRDDATAVLRWRWRAGLFGAGEARALTARLTELIGGFAAVPEVRPGAGAAGHGRDRYPASGHGGRPSAAGADG